MDANLQRDVQYDIGVGAKDGLLRAMIVVGTLALLALGIYIGYMASRLGDFQTTANLAGGYSSSAYTLLTRSAMVWVMFSSPVLGIFFAARRSAAIPETVVNGKVLRHDPLGFYLEHCVLGIGVLTMIVTAIIIGSPTYIHRLVVAPQDIGFGFNVHVVGVILTLFGFTYHLTNRVLNGDYKDFLPSGSDFGRAFARLLGALGIGAGDTEPAGKFTPGQKISYLAWMIVVACMLGTGAMKVSTYIVPLPPTIMGPVNKFYAFVLFLGVVLATVHIVLAVLVPYSWPRLRAIVTGYMKEDQAKASHGAWYQKIKK